MLGIEPRVGPRNHVLDMGTDPPKKGAILGVVRAIQKHSSLLQRRCRVRTCNRDHPFNRYARSQQ